MKLAVRFLLSILLLSFVEAQDVVLPPIQSSTLPIVVGIMIEGAEIAPSQYTPLFKELQTQMLPNNSLWIGMPEMLFDTPNPESLTYAIPRIIEAMKSQGLTTSNNTLIPLFFFAHSLGGVDIQQYLSDSANVESLNEAGFKVIGQVLMGSFLNRNQRQSGKAYPIHTLTVGGELDGLCHITRIAEAYYTQLIKPWWTSDPVNSTVQNNYPVVIIKGINHFRFASGAAPFLVRERDLQAEVDEPTAHLLIAQLLSTWIWVQLYPSRLGPQQDLTQYLQTSNTLLDPIISGFLKEGFYHFLPPCNPTAIRTTSSSSSCQEGSEWSEYAQQFIGGIFPDNQNPSPVLFNASVTSNDHFHLVYLEHFPSILSNCSSGEASCVVNISTVTQNEYDTLDSFDTGFGAIAATEMRIKMISRQAILQAAAFVDVNFTQTDDNNNLCAQLNQASIDWATNTLQTNNPVAIQRFQKFGQPLQVIADEPVFGDAGPLWVFTSLQFESAVTADNITVMTVASPVLVTPTDFFLSSIAGFHYCKLLSPARAIEWILVDGLRLHYSFQP